MPEIVDLTADDIDEPSPKRQKVEEPILISSSPTSPENAVIEVDDELEISEVRQVQAEDGNPDVPEDSEPSEEERDDNTNLVHQRPQRPRPRNIQTKTYEATDDIYTRLLRSDMTMTDDVTTSVERTFKETFNSSRYRRLENHHFEVFTHFPPRLTSTGGSEKLIIVKDARLDLEAFEKFLTSPSTTLAKISYEGCVSCSRSRYTVEQSGHHSGCPYEDDMPAEPSDIEDGEAWEEWMYKARHASMMMPMRSFYKMSLPFKYLAENGNEQTIQVQCFSPVVDVMLGTAELGTKPYAFWQTVRGRQRNQSKERRRMYFRWMKCRMARSRFTLYLSGSVRGGGARGELVPVSQVSFNALRVEKTYTCKVYRRPGRYDEMIAYL